MARYRVSAYHSVLTQANLGLSVAKASGGYYVIIRPIGQAEAFHTMCLYAWGGGGDKVLVLPDLATDAADTLRVYLFTSLLVASGKSIALLAGRKNIK